MHRHLNDYVVVVLEGGKLEEETLEGKRELIRSQQGEVLWIQRGAIHATRNIGRARVSAMVIEVKGERLASGEQM